MRLSREEQKYKNKLLFFLVAKIQKELNRFEFFVLFVLIQKFKKKK